jgi:hypothetical protein
MLVRLDHGVLIAVGCGERDEAASQAERAGCHAHRYGVKEPPDETMGGPQLTLI